MMTAEQLLDSLLQLAMQGKLVEQRPEEGTGEDLYNQIIEKKRKCAKKGKKPNNITDDDAPFEIPDTWKWTRLGDIIEFRMGKTPPRSESVYWKDDIPWFSIADMIEGKTVTETKEKVSKKAFEDRFNGQISPKGTLIMSFKLTVGKVSILGVDAVHNEAIISIFPYIDIDFAMRDYLKTMLPFLSVYGESKKAIKGFTLNSTSLNNIPVPLPPIEEQKRIVAKIEELMPYVEQYAEASTKLNTLNTSFPDMMKKSILQEAVQGKLVPQDPNDEPASELLKRIAEEKQRLIKEGKIKKQKADYSFSDEDLPFDVPESWSWARLGDICYDLRYGTSSKSNKTGEVIVLRMGNIQDGEIDYTDLVYSSNKEDNNKYKLEPLDILFNRTNSRELVGKTGIYRGEHPAIFAGYLVQVRPIEIDPEYLNYVMNSEYERNYCKDVKSDGINQSNVNATKIGQFLIPIPPINEQHRIVDQLNGILPMVKVYQQKYGI